jgi:ketosteroid isomerase-like protein
MMRSIARIGLGIACAIGAATAPGKATGHGLQGETAVIANQVRDTERAFARSMADRNHAAFVSFLSDEAVFMSEVQTLRGKPAIGEGWKRFYDAPQPPFSWEPERVEVLDSGTLALSTGPVRDPQGRRVGTFNSIWRREPGGSWKIVFDKGCPPCEGSLGACPTDGRRLGTFFLCGLRACPGRSSLKSHRAKAGPLRSIVTLA